ncbi:hypothetical protein THAOC_30469, partial [Thalassiosira oceanica]
RGSVTAAGGGGTARDPGRNRGNRGPGRLSRVVKTVDIFLPARSLVALRLARFSFSPDFLLPAPLVTVSPYRRSESNRGSSEAPSGTDGVVAAIVGAVRNRRRAIVDVVLPTRPGLSVSLLVAEVQGVKVSPRLPSGRERKAPVVRSDLLLCPQWDSHLSSPQSSSRFVLSRLSSSISFIARVSAALQSSFPVSSRARLSGTHIARVGWLAGTSGPGFLELTRDARNGTSPGKGENERAKSEGPCEPLRIRDRIASFSDLPIEGGPAAAEMFRREGSKE